MPDHPARFPGITNVPATHVLTGRQAARLSATTHIPAAELAGKKLAEVESKLRPLIDPGLLAFRRICGRVVKTDAGSDKDLPVPFATVTVSDVDFRFLAWSPPGSPFSWFWPFRIVREKLATVTTDECGRFCVWVPRFDIDFYVRWRLAFRCYPTWLRKPNIEDLLRAYEVIPGPQPDPGPLRLDERVLTHAARILSAPALARLREVAAPLRGGAAPVETSAALTRAAFPTAVRPPLPAAALEMLTPAKRSTLAARVGVSAAALEKLEEGRWIGPFIRCREVIVPEWKLVLDVPDLSFQVTQDINGDGAQEVIYRDGLFDVRWDMNVGDLTLHADPSAIAGVSCDIPDPGPCGDPAILFASNYPLQLDDTRSEFHDNHSGYAKLPNRPDADGIPGGAREAEGKAPFVDPFYLVGCAEHPPKATHYRIHHQIDNGSATFLNGSYGPLMKVVGGSLHQKVVSPVEGQWYPIVPRSEGWTPVGILAPVYEGGDHRHTFLLELGAAASPGGAITPITDIPKIPSVNLQIDNTPPTIDFVGLSWRHPDTSLAWKPLTLFSSTECPVIRREGSGRVQLHLSLRVSADHLRSFKVTPIGCGTSAPAPQLITDRRDGLPELPVGKGPDYWYRSTDENVQTRELYYEIPAGAPAGCYHFSVRAATRAFRPTILPDPTSGWRLDDEAVWQEPWLSFSVQ